MKTYGIPFLVFVIAHGVAAMLYMLLMPLLSKDEAGLIMKSVMCITFLICILRLVKNKTSLFAVGKIKPVHVYISLILFVLFGVNNYFMANYSSQTEFMGNSSFALVVLVFVVNSFYEEFAYRGFIQSYVNERLPQQNKFISKGNLFASFLMFTTHVGFFAVMSPLFATTGLILVVLFSLGMGYIRDRGGSLWLVILLHTLVNAIHVVLNLEHYV